MSRGQYHKRVDSNQAAVIGALRKAGMSAESTATLGRGLPDIIVGYRGLNVWLEVKDGSRPPSKRELTKDEAWFHNDWKGQVCVVECPAEAVEVVLRHARKFVATQKLKLIAAKKGKDVNGN